MGGWFSRSQTDESNLLKACEFDDVATARNVIAKLSQSEVGRSLGAKLDSIKDDEGKTALMVAAHTGSLDVLKILLQNGASTEVRHADYATTALHYAADKGSRDIIVVLLDAGADVTVANSAGFTPVDVARSSNQVQALRALEKRSALFTGWLKWERSTRVQAGLGKLLGAQLKEAMLEKFGGEWRECWAVVSKLAGKVSNVMMCPSCRSQFTDSREPGLKINCPSCSAELHIPRTASIMIMELAIYESPFVAKPEITFPISVVSVQSEFLLKEMSMRAVRVYVQRSPELVRRGSRHLYGVVDPRGRNPIWTQQSLTAKRNSSTTKKMVFAVDDEPSARQHLERFIEALRHQPVNAVAYVKQTMMMNDSTVFTDVTSTAEWSCQLCTFKNSSASHNCMICGTASDTSPEDLARIRNSVSATTARSGSAPLTSANSNQRATIVPPPPVEVSEDYFINDQSEISEIPVHFICPLTNDIMEDPVVTVDGMSYERKAITEHFERHGAVSPVTLMPLQSRTISPNIALRHAIQDWKASIPVASIVVI